MFYLLQGDYEVLKDGQSICSVGHGSLTRCSSSIQGYLKTAPVDAYGPQNVA